MVQKKIKLSSLKTNLLSKKRIEEICSLKIDGWKFNLHEQKKWFKKNIQKNDLHNCLTLDGNLAGYTCLRKRKYFFLNKKKNYLLFDTIVIKKNYRNLKLGKKLMKYNNKIIKQNKLPSFLLTTKKKLNFYKKFKWKKNNHNFFLVNHILKKNKILMNFNFKEKQEKKSIFMVLSI